MEKTGKQRQLATVHNCNTSMRVHTYVHTYNRSVHTEHPKSMHVDSMGNANRPDYIIVIYKATIHTLQGMAEYLCPPCGPVMGDFTSRGGRGREWEV